MIRIAGRERFFRPWVLEGYTYMRNETQNTRAGELAGGERVEKKWHETSRTL
jgi:hypothetical protein